MNETYTREISCLPHWLKSPWRLYHLHRLVPQRLAGGSKEQPPVTTP